MHNLTPLTALGGTDPREDHYKGVSLTERPGIALASVTARKGEEAACRAHIENLLGAVPGPGKIELHDPEAGFWIGPDAWMVTAPFDSHEDLAAQLVAHFGPSASITEQTDAWVCFDLRGEGMDAVMELLSNINFRAMKTGDAQRTTIHHLSCFVTRQDPQDWVRIIGPRASATSLHHAILTAMKSAL